jgi:uncharacterized membrane protein YfcA
MDGPLAGWSLAMVIPTFIGFSVGEVIRRYLDGNRFRGALLWLLLIMGLNLVRRALM